MSFTVQVNSTTEFILRPPRTGKRNYLLIQNKSGNEIDINEDTHADTNNGEAVNGGQFWERSAHTSLVPQGNIYINGTVAAPATQTVIIDQK